MTKELFAIHIADASAFARSLVGGLRERHAAHATPPGQVEMLNLMARAQGLRNWQALRQAVRAGALTGSTAPAIGTASISPAPPALSPNARRALAQFDDHGRLLRWPVKFSVQRLAMWVLWTRFDAKRAYTEREVNAILKAANLFSDHVTLRRELINHRLMARKSDCSEYRKLPARPDDETRALLTAWRARYRDQASGRVR